MTGTPEPSAVQGSCEVLIVGGGPTGLFLASLLAGRGLDVVVLEKRRVPSRHSRAIGLHPPALGALRELGLDREAVAGGVPLRSGAALSQGRHLGHVRFAARRTPNRFVLSLPQSRTEEMLARRLAALSPTALRRGWEVTQVLETAGGVEVTARRTAEQDGAAPHGSSPLLRWRARLLVVADGARSGTRTSLGIAMRGRALPDTYLMGDFAEETPSTGARAAGRRPREARIHLEADGVVESFPMPDARRRWVVHTGPTGAGPPSSAHRLAALLQRRLGEAPDPDTATMISAFTVAQRFAARLCTRRCVVIGDAAHEISPIGGQGMTLGWLDALDIAPLVRGAIATDQAPDLSRDADWGRIERRIMRRARTAGAIAGLNTALGRPVGRRLSLVRAAALRLVLGTRLRILLAWVYSMGWVGAARR